MVVAWFPNRNTTSADALGGSSFIGGFHASSNDSL
jgi:hypothetical protein